MDPRRPVDQDFLIRDVFDCDSESVARVVRRALSGPGSRRGWEFGTLLVVAALVLALFGPMLWRPPQSPDRDRGSAEILIGSIESGMLVVRLPDGSVSISSVAERTDRPPQGSGMVTVQGGFE